MIIPLKFPNNDSYGALPSSLATLGTGEVVLVELQGFLEVDGERAGELIGTLGLDIPDRPTLTIGHHLLEGKLANLPKPLAVLSRNAPPPNAHVQSILDASAATDSSPIKPTPATAAADESTEKGDEDNGSFDVVALVKRKIVFAKRPVPITQGNLGTSVPQPTETTR
ncbi:hypothetical protein FRB95_004387 [Tulasnella sp. JGI-2019a]|nr:hypothetical protein FRB95_004387 [Tulasnella sp. JGI-2019a]